mmetsp:Transcript_61380/g.123021  ORF Transcript_61380/g.123021 Transcript_61380/m.123021 type:complete len:333 (-) Transcript_61380:1872-2870(-)
MVHVRVGRASEPERDDGVLRQEAQRQRLPVRLVRPHGLRTQPKVAVEPVHHLVHRHRQRIGLPRDCGLPGHQRGAHRDPGGGPVGGGVHAKQPGDRTPVLRAARVQLGWGVASSRDHVHHHARRELSRRTQRALVLFPARLREPALDPELRAALRGRPHHPARPGVRHHLRHHLEERIFPQPRAPHGRLGGRVHQLSLLQLNASRHRQQLKCFAGYHPQHQPPLQAAFHRLLHLRYHRRHLRPIRRAVVRRLVSLRLSVGRGGAARVPQRGGLLLAHLLPRHPHGGHGGGGGQREQPRLSVLGQGRLRLVVLRLGRHLALQHHYRFDRGHIL